MDINGLEPVLRAAVIRAIDGISRKAAQSERAAEGAIARLLRQWNEMNTADKERVAAMVIAGATAAAGMIASLRARRPKTPKSAAKRAATTIRKKKLV